jgi:hypothetical protein
LKVVRISAILEVAKGRKMVMGTLMAWYMAMDTNTSSEVMLPPTLTCVMKVNNRMNLTEKKLGAKMSAWM